MNIYTVVAYDVPADGHHIETFTAVDATDAALQLLAKLGHTHADLEIVAVAIGTIQRFALLDASLVALAPHSPAAP
ncbi:MAG: hypothetical protein PHQ04_03945 [Opitutaceae bacterium]|nr:hypothetical protein [Opitutaceae bacterium]